MRVVLVEDNESLRYAIATVLKKRGFELYEFDAAEALIESLPKGTIDLFILDINLPDMDGLELMEVLRPYFEFSDFIFISSYADMRHISRAFSLGCEDYLKKPFEIEELLLRLERVVQRRSVSGMLPFAENCIYNVDDLELTVDGTAVPLTPKEGKILEMLIRDRGHAVSYDAIAERVWGEAVEQNTIASVVRRLRKKLGNNAIVSIRGQGYRLA